MFSVREEVCKIVVKKITTEELIREGAYKSANKELTNENFPFRVFQNSFSGEKRIRFIETHGDCYEKRQSRGNNGSIDTGQCTEGFFYRVPFC